MKSPIALRRAATRRRPAVKAITLLASAALGISAFSFSAAPAQAAVSTKYTTWYSAAGYSSYYHVIANNIDWSKPVGTVFYFDGDYFTISQSNVEPTPNAKVQSMAKVANDRNMVFIPVVSPDTNGAGDGYTWWENYNGNGDWFRSLASSIISSAGLDRSNIWTMGYSGGAEFISLETAADRQGNWRTGGGDLMIGGGTPPGSLQSYIPTANKKIPMYWYVGTNDGVGATYPATWSAYGAATAGKNFYSSQGFSRTYFRPQSGLNHYQYNHAAYLRQVLDENKRTTTYSSSFTLRGAIGAYYYANGAATKFGQPTLNEFKSVDGGYVQNFSKNYSIYWSPNTGAHHVKWSGALGTAFAKARYEFNWGYPAIDEAPYGYGWKQYFRKGNYLTAAYWSSRTGTHTIHRGGAISNYWIKKGHIKTFGLPVTNETRRSDGSYYVKFENGKTINWTAQRGIWVS